MKNTNNQSGLLCYEIKTRCRALEFGHFRYARLFAEEYRENVCLFRRRDGWNLGDCELVIMTHNMPLTVDEVCYRVFGDGYTYLDDEMLEKHRECLIKLPDFSLPYHVKKWKEVVWKCYGKHCIVGIDWEYWAFESERIEENFRVGVYEYFYGVLLVRTIVM